MKEKKHLFEIFIIVICVYFGDAVSYFNPLCKSYEAT